MAGPRAKVAKASAFNQTQGSKWRGRASEKNRSTMARCVRCDPNADQGRNTAEYKRRKSRNSGARSRSIGFQPSSNIPCRQRNLDPHERRNIRRTRSTSTDRASRWRAGPDQHGDEPQTVTDELQIAAITASAGSIKQNAEIMIDNQNESQTKPGGPRLEIAPRAQIKGGEHIDVLNEMENGNNDHTRDTRHRDIGTERHRENQKAQSPEKGSREKGERSGEHRRKHRDRTAGRAHRSERQPGIPPIEKERKRAKMGRDRETPHNNYGAIERWPAEWFGDQFAEIVALSVATHDRHTGKLDGGWETDATHAPAHGGTPHRDRSQRGGARNTQERSDHANGSTIRNKRACEEAPLGKTISWQRESVDAPPRGKCAEHVPRDRAQSRMGYRRLCCK